VSENNEPGKPRKGKLGALRLIRETGSDPPPARSRERTLVRSPSDVFGFMKGHTESEEAEVFWILALDTQNRVLFDSPIVITRGILNSSLVHPREVFRSAIVAGAAGIILVHNHPSGDPTPSADDRAVTQQLVATGKLLDLPVHDHVIIGHSAYVSFAEQGLL
jgi:DNA repair protein RadC